MISLLRRAATFTTIISLAGVGACASAAGGDPPAIPDGRSETTVYLIRHAEKTSDTEEDPDLSARGRARAESLAVQLRDSGVNIIITSHLRRTRQTAAPLAKLRNIRPTVIPISPTLAAHERNTALEVLRHPGATVLVVGHNNTIPNIVDRLGGGKIGDICTWEYANLIIMTLEKGRPPRILVESYGVPDPPQPNNCPPLLSR